MLGVFSKDGEGTTYHPATARLVHVFDMRIVQHLSPYMPESSGNVCIHVDICIAIGRQLAVHYCHATLCRGAARIT